MGMHWQQGGKNKSAALCSKARLKPLRGGASPTRLMSVLIESSPPSVFLGLNKRQYKKQQINQMCYPVKHVLSKGENIKNKTNITNCFKQAITKKRYEQISTFSALSEFIDNNEHKASFISTSQAQRGCQKNAELGFKNERRPRRAGNDWLIGCSRTQ